MDGGGAVGYLIGYARVSTVDQNPQLQLDALERAGCDRVVTEKASGMHTERPVLAAVLADLRAGDTLVVWRLDRLGRSMRHLIETVNVLEERGVGFRSLQEAIDTTTPAGRLVFHVFGALAEFERALITERTLAGLAAAREKGRLGGRPSVMTAAKMRQLRAMAAAGEKPGEIAKALGVGRATVYRHLEPLVVQGVAADPGAVGEGAMPPPPPGLAGPAERVRRAGSRKTVAAPARLEPAPESGAAAASAGVGRGGGRRFWYVVEAAADPAAPVVVLSRHTSERSAAAALSKARSRRRPGSYGGAGDAVVLAVRSAEQVTARLVWDPELRRGVVRQGPPEP